ncbi:MAG: hypothetical protein HYU80_02935 [Candidatus Blackburnbacteria bacterium]|nr:hypothetical protein [Candidatus Blackburnbacteria bacterium]
MIVERGEPSSDIVITRDNPTPVVVARNTAFLMDLCLIDWLPDKQPALGYLAGETLDYLLDAENGFLKNLNKIDRTGKIDAFDYQRFMEIAQRSGKPSPRETDEAFGFALVTFSVLPDMATSRFLPKGFSRRAALAPPFTTREFFLRIRELRSIVMQFIAGKFGSHTVIETHPPLLRTYQFFQVAKDIPLHVQEQPGLIAQRTDDIAKRLLSDILN